jgi:hypothetical protein
MHKMHANVFGSEMNDKYQIKFQDGLHNLRA